MLAQAAAKGDRFAGLFATRSPGGALVLSAHVTSPGGIDTLEAALPAGAGSYPALTPRLGAAFWYEREIHDDFGVVPEGQRADVRPVVTEDNGNGSEAPGQPHLEYSSDVIEVVGTYLYQPGRRLFDMAVRTAKRLQSGRLDAYLLYMLIALIAIIAVVTALA